MLSTKEASNEANPCEDAKKRRSLPLLPAASVLFPSTSSSYSLFDSPFEGIAENALRCLADWLRTPNLKRRMGF